MACQEKTAASVAETEEVAAASMEPKLTPEADFKARRSEAIKAKALDIEKVVRFAPRSDPTSVYSVSLLLMS